MKIHDVDQKSLEWLALRAGIPTASELDALLTPLWKVKTGDGPRTYLCKKLAEWWQGGPLPSFQGFSMDQGNVLEEEALPWYSLAYDASISRVGFITTDSGQCGCSPDGLIEGAEIGIEAKCPEAHTHTSYLLAGVVPPEYLAQVHGSMHVTGYKQWKFISYRRGFPKLVITVERDEKIQEQIEEALELFWKNFNEAKARLIEINGGPPRHTLKQRANPPCPAETMLNAMAADAKKPYSPEVLQ